MELKQRIESFVKLGEFLRDYSNGDKELGFSKKLNEIVINDHIQNPWFTEKNVKKAISAIGESLKVEKIESWINRYPYLKKKNPVRNIGVITAGNIPLVGFHDFISVLISGHNVFVKQSSNDKHLLP
ncbi:MAG: acyl-CoA reductase, partial [Marinilabiliales bacterium]